MRYFISKTIITVVLLLLILPNAQASYIENGRIIILRSQFVENNNQIDIDGSLEDSAWSKSNAKIVSYSQPEPVQVSIKYMNTFDNLFFAVEATSFNSTTNDFILITFDTDNDGILTGPEDGKLINSEGVGTDLYWNGTGWQIDGEADGEDSEFRAASSSGDGKIKFELRCSLTSSNLPYDGFRIPDPAATMIGVNLQYVEHITENGTTSAVAYNFPTTPNNSSSYITLKLAGPADQDLPEYVPPTTEQLTNQPDAPVYETIGGAADFRFSFIMIGIVSIFMLRIKRRDQ